MIISTNRGEPLTLTDSKSPAKKCYLNVSQRLTGEDVPIIDPIQLVINRVRPNMMASQEMLSIEDVQEILSLPLLGIVLEDEQVIISTNRGEPLTLSDSRSPAKKCYLNVSQRLTGAVSYTHLTQPTICSV